MKKNAKNLLFIGFITLLMGGTPLAMLGQLRQLEEDVVYLQNGSVIRGTITEQIPRESVTIQTFDGTVFRFLTSEIDRIVREPSRFTQIKVRFNSNVVPITYDDRPQWYWGYGLSLSTNQSSGNFHVEPRAGYKWRHWLHTGLSSGLNPYNAGLILPIAAELRGDLLKKAVTPHYYLQGGYGVAATRSQRHRVFEGGLLYGGGIGLSFKSRKKAEYFFTVGYKWQGTYQEFEEWPPRNPNNPNQVQESVLVTGNRNYRRIVTMFSVHF